MKGRRLGAAPMGQIHPRAKSRQEDHGVEVFPAPAIVPLDADT